MVRGEASPTVTSRNAALVHVAASGDNRRALFVQHLRRKEVLDRSRARLVGARLSTGGFAIP